MRHRPLIIALVLASILFGVAFPRLRMDSDILTLLPPNLPELQSLLTMRQQFQEQEDLLVGLHANDPELLDEAADSLGQTLRKVPGLVGHMEGDSARAMLREASQTLGWMIANAPPDKVQSFRDRLAPGKVEAHLEEVVDRIGSTMDMAEIQLLAYDPFGFTDVIDVSLDGDDGPFQQLAASGDLKLVRMAPPDKAASYREAHTWTRDVRETIERWKANRLANELEVPSIWITGELAFMAETGMGIERDFSSTIAITFTLISLLFWFTLRSLKPLAVGMGMVLITLVITVSIGALLLGAITAMSMGFAAVVQGLVVDYGALIYRHAMIHPEWNAKQLRGAVQRPILAAAVTTSVVFAALTLGQFPGLKQFGILVATGTLVGAVIMLFVFTPLVPKLARTHKRQPSSPLLSRPLNHRFALIATLMLVSVVIISFAWRGLPHFDPSTSSMRPRHSEAMDAWEKIQLALGQDSEVMVPVLVRGDSAEELSGNLTATAEALSKVQNDNNGLRWWSPQSMVPQTEAQQANAAALRWILSQRERLSAAAQAADLEEDALSLFNDLMDWWETTYLPAEKKTLPGLVRQTLTHTQDQWYAVGSIFLTRPADLDLSSDAFREWFRLRMRTLEHALSGQSSFASLTGWMPLGPAIARAAREDVLTQSGPVAVILLVTLIIVLRRPREIVLAILSLTLCLTACLAFLRLLNRPLNMANIAAFPLIAGAGIDYSIHILLALRERRDIKMVQHLIGKALVICALSSCIGFSSLLLAGNRGVFDLGLACSGGLILSAIIALALLPYWWKWCHREVGDRSPRFE